MGEINPNFTRKRAIRLIALILSIALIFTSFPSFAYAAVEEIFSEPDAGQDVANEEESLADTLILEEDASEDNVITEENTEDSTTFDLGNGKKMVIYHGQNVRYEEDGELIDYDPSLVEVDEDDRSENGKNLKGYRFENKQGDKKQYMPEELSEETPIRMENGKYSIEMVPIENQNVESVSLETEETLTPYETVEEKEVKAIYELSDKKQRYEYTSLSDGIKETIVLEENPENNVFTFNLNLDGLIAELNEEENIILLKDKENEELQAVIEKPFMNDKSEEAYSEDLSYSVKEGEDDGEYVVELTVSRDYLDDEERIYPVTIDPTATWKGEDTFLDVYVVSGSVYGDINFYDSSTKVMPVGKDANSYTYRTYIKFPNLKANLDDKYIHTAYLTVYETAQSKADQTIRINRVTESWTTSSITWNNKPSHYSTSANSFTTTGETYASHKVGVTTMCRNFVNENDNPNYGIVLRNTTTSPTYAEFFGSRTSASSYRPKLVITYYDKPTAASSISTSRKTSDTTYYKSSYMKESYRMYVNWSGIESHNLADVQYKIIAGNDSTPDPTSISSDEVDLTNYRSLGVSTASGTNVSVPYSPSLPAGKYRLYIRGKDAGGMYGAAKYKVFYVDDDTPTLSNVKSSPSTTSTSKTNDLTPTISWTASDTYFSKVTISVDGGTAVTATDSSGNGSYTIPEGKITSTGTHTIKVKAVDKSGKSTSKTISYYVDVTGPSISSMTVSPVTSTSQYSNDKTPTISWSITASDLDTVSVYVNNELKKTVDSTTTSWTPTAAIGTTSGKYTLKIKATDVTGNSTTKTKSYYLDVTKPVGTITTTLQGTGTASDELNSTSNIAVTASDEHSDISSVNLFLYDSNGTLVHDFGAATEGENYDLDTTKYANGSYTLKLNIKDTVGNTAVISKDITILNRIDALTLSTHITQDTTSKINWSISDGSKLAKIQYKIEDGEWIDAVETNGAISSGVFNVILPAKNSTYTVYVRGIDTDGESGKESSVKCISDSNAPTISIDGYSKGYLKGSIRDSNNVQWSLLIKEKGADDSTYKTIGTGSGIVKSDEIAFIDLSGDEYIAGKGYTVKLIAIDTAGNTAEATYDIYKSASNTPSLKKAELFIDLPDYQDGTNNIIIPSETESINLTEDSITSSTKWYVNNLLVSEENSYEDDFSTGDENTYQEDVWYSLFVVRENVAGEKTYCTDIIENGLSAEVSLSDYKKAETEIIETVSLDSSKVVAFTLVEDDEQIEGVTYKIKSGDSAYKTISPNEKVYISDKFGQGYSESLTLKVTCPEGETINDVSFRFDIVDSKSDKSFKVSYIENFRPENLSVSDKINYKTYIKWTNEITEDTPDEVYYEVERATTEDFEDGTVTCAASNVKNGYYSEININYSSNFYYKVRAVWDDGTTKRYSSYSDQIYSRVVDSNEYTKRMGVKEYWEFADIEMATGELSVEKSMGNLVYSQIDASVPNEQLEVELNRTYNSQSSAKSAFGVGWTHDYDIELLKICENDELNNNNIVMKDGSGTIYHFVKGSDSVKYSSSLGKYIELVIEEKTETVYVPERNYQNTSGSDDMRAIEITSTYTATTKDNIEYRFNSGGQLVYLGEPNGNFMIFEYEDEKGRLVKATTSKNLSIEFIYNSAVEGDPLTVKEIKLPDGSSIKYEYEGDTGTENVRLVKVTEYSTKDEETISYEYGYGTDSGNTTIPNLNVIKDALGNQYSVTYNANDQVNQVTYPDGESIRFRYEAVAAVALETDIETVNDLENLGYTTQTTTERIVDGQTVAKETDCFNGFGNCVSSTDIDGYTTNYTYLDHLLSSTVSQVQSHYIDENGYIQEAAKEKTESVSYEGNDEENETAETEEDGSVTTFEYGNSNENCDDFPTHETEIDGNGEKVFDISHTYDEYGNETCEIDSVSGTKTVTTYYNQDSTTGLKGEVKSEVEYLNGVVQSSTTYQYSYDAEGNKTETTTEVCADETIVTSVTYDCMGREISTTDSRGKRTDNTFDGFGRLIKTVYTDGDIVTTVTKQYNDNGALVQEVSEDGTVTAYQYDNMNRVISRTVTKDSFTKTWTTDYSYETIDIHTGRGNATETVENAFVTTEKNPDGEITSQTYQNHKDQIVRQLENGIYVDMTYDGQGNVYTQYEMGTEQDSEEEGLLTVFVYDDAGNLTDTVLNPDYKEDKGFYTGGGAIVESSTFDASGNALTNTDGEGNQTSFTYDVEGNLTSVTLPDGTVTSFTYDQMNEDGTTTNTVIDALGRKSETISDEGALDIKVSDLGDGSVDSIHTEFEYDANENVIKETYSSGSYCTYEYDGRDRKVAANYWSASKVQTLKTTYEYDISDNLTLMKDYKIVDGQEVLVRYTKYTYDSLKRLVAVAEVDGPGTPTEAEITANTLTYNYDIDDNLISIEYPDTGSKIKEVKFTYDYRKWITGVYVNVDGAGDKLVREYLYGNDGKLTEVKDYKGILTEDEGYISRKYSYDEFERTTEMTYADSSNLEEELESYSYTYDKNNNILSERIVNSYPDEEGDKTDELRIHEYDSVGRLVKTVITDYQEDGKETTYTYSYDKVGNRTKETEVCGSSSKSTSYTYNSLNQLVASTETTDGTVTSEKAYVYDKDGNQTKETDSTSGEVRTQTYDEAGNMVRLVKTVNDVVELTQENQYNGNGQRIQKTEADETTKYFYEGDSVLYTTDEDGTLTAQNVLGNGDNVIATTRGTEDNESYYLYNKDIRESTTNVLDSSGVSQVSYEYSDFGETEITGDEEFYNEICYSGGIYDESTGIYYLNARYYDPEAGIFLTQDSYRGEYNDPLSLNLYAYCKGNPITYTDPSGHFPIVAAAIWAYRGYKVIKTARAVYKTAKTVKKVYRVAKTINKLSKAKKAYKVVNQTKKVVRVTKKIKTSKNLKKIIGKTCKSSRVKKVTKTAAKKKVSHKRTNEQLVKDVASRAERKIGGTGRVAGTKKHNYANRLLKRYQQRYGDRGLRTEVTYKGRKSASYGTKGSVRIDVYDTKRKVAYDYKFTQNKGRALSRRQVRKIKKNGPTGFVRVKEVNP